MEYEEIKKIIADMGDSKLDSLDIEFADGTKISMKKNQGESIINSNIPVVIPHQLPTVGKSKEITVVETQEENIKTVKSPMVGTFYSSSSPNNPPFVKVGDAVKKGDTLCIIEAMKLMNEIESEYEGEIIEILAQNEQMVEYGMPMFKIK